MGYQTVVTPAPMRTLRTVLVPLVLAALPASAALAATSGDKTVPELEGSVSPTVDKVGGPPGRWR
jgi:hypothetical protein